MASTYAVASTGATRPAGLVTVDGRTYPLTSARLVARAEGGIAATIFTQTYSNPYEEPLEVLYTLPLPADGAVIAYSVRLGQRTICGEVRSRQEAQEEYRRALLDGRTAALLDQERADTFTQRLGSLPPGLSAEVEIEVLHPLAYLPAGVRGAAQWEYRFPTVAGVRYEGAEGRVPDAGSLDVDRAEGAGTPVRLAASLVLADGPAALLHPEVAGREIDLKDDPDGVRVTLKEGMRLDRDLVVRWCAAREEAGVRLVEGKGLRSDDGRYALLTITPPGAAGAGFARDLTVLIDASGSMAGIPIGRARSIVGELVRSLDAGDRFEILAFSDRVKRITKGTAEATPENLRQAIESLERLEAGGATEMTRAMIEALKPLRPDSLRQVVLLTDGYIGFEGEVIGEVLSRLAPGARLHAVGIGSAPNRTLTHGVARAGRGVEILVGDEGDARDATRRLLQATVRPVLTEIELGGESLVSAAPARPRDVLAGQPLVLLAEIKPGGGELVIRGKRARDAAPWERRIRISRGGAEDESLLRTPIPVGALFGREAIEDLELQLAAAGSGRSPREIESSIERLGLRHGIASRMTSLVAISEDRTVDPRDPRRHERLAVEIPAGVSAEGAGLMLAQMAAFPDLEETSLMPSALFLLPAAPTRPPMAPRKGRKQFDRDVFQEIAAETRREEPLHLNIPAARVLQLEDRVLVIEFEVPEPAMALPGDGAVIRVHFIGGPDAQARVLGQRSTRPGMYPAGLTVRLGLKIEEPHCWRHREAVLFWAESLQRPGGPERTTIAIKIKLTPENWMA